MSLISQLLSLLYLFHTSRLPPAGLFDRALTFARGLQGGKSLESSTSKVCSRRLCHHRLSCNLSAHLAFPPILRQLVSVDLRVQVWCHRGRLKTGRGERDCLASDCPRVATLFQNSLNAPNAWVTGVANLPHFNICATLAVLK